MVSSAYIFAGRQYAGIHIVYYDLLPPEVKDSPDQLHVICVDDYAAPGVVIRFRQASIDYRIFRLERKRNPVV